MIYQSNHIFLQKIRIYVRTHCGQKINQTIKINFISSKDGDEKRLMYCAKNSKQIMIAVNAKEIIEKIF